MTFAKHEYDFDKVDAQIEDGSYLVTAPKRMGNIRLSWNATPAARAELEWVHMSEYYLKDGNDKKYQGHDVINLRVSDNLNSQLMI